MDCECLLLVRFSLFLVLCNEQGSYIKMFSEAMLNDATQERASTQSPGSWGSRRSQKSSNTPAVSAGFVLLQGMFVPAPFPHTHADSVHELSISTSELSTCSSGTELTATGKGRAFCPLLSADGLGELVATHRS